MTSSRSETGQEKPEEPLLDEQNPVLAFPTASSQSIHSSTGNPEKPLPNEQKSSDNGEQSEPPKLKDLNDPPPEIPRPWSLYDPFVYAPPKPDRDPWSILLEPLLKKDKLQCDVWKEEVQNLLIFAGLFSAVVTAFIIESYKTLTPDPNDAIISLLSVIANRLDNTTSSTSVLLSSIGPGPSFSPTMSSIRINSFWFISLVLSLATVLVGIISLQWIREHQNYPNLSPKKSFALFNMRADGLEKWHVPKIFTALPLLLQSALVLFLGGIVDFLLAFGDIVVIPVSVVTVLVLLFLVATTLLPTLQSILLCLPYPYTRTSKTPPPQCPYKSPQAHAFRAMLSSIIRLCVKISSSQSLSRSLRDELRRVDFAMYIMITWTKKTWSEFDMAWLRMRDHFMQRSYKRFSLRSANDVDRDPPLFDLTQALLESANSRDIGLFQNSLSAQYHCFAEVSTWIADRDNELAWEVPQPFFQTNAYLRDMMTHNQIDCSTGLSHFFNFAAYRDGRELWGVSKLLHQENVVLFLGKLESSPGFQNFDKALKFHMLELAMRLSTIVHMEEYERSATPVWPKCLSLYNRTPYHLENDRNYDPLFYQWVNNFSTFFQRAARVQPPYIPRRTLYTYPDTVDYIVTSARVSLHDTFSLAEGLRPAIQGKFLEAFQTITENLNEQMSSPGFREPNLLFYLTALYLHAVKKRHWYEPYHRCLDNLLLAMWTYKERTIGAGVSNGNLEEIYQPGLFDSPGDPAKFSPKWWDFLKGPSFGGSSKFASHLSIHGATEPLHA